mmetsp:Transcript_46152/g.74339  ORF Transcript_46152/g.74339 Transcript_46152/m.74339 type:complete len:287 (+) Transcript_46152:185-1045(+)
MGTRLRCTSFKFCRCKRLTPCTARTVSCCTCSSRFSSSLAGSSSCIASSLFLSLSSFFRLASRFASRGVCPPVSPSVSTSSWLPGAECASALPRAPPSSSLCSLNSSRARARARLRRSLAPKPSLAASNSGACFLRTWLGAAGFIPVLALLTQSGLSANSIAFSLPPLSSASGAPPWPCACGKFFPYARVPPRSCIPLALRAAASSPRAWCRNSLLWYFLFRLPLTVSSRSSIVGSNISRGLVLPPVTDARSRTRTDVSLGNDPVSAPCWRCTCEPSAKSSISGSP